MSGSTFIISFGSLLLVVFMLQVNLRDRGFDSESFCSCVDLKLEISVRNLKCVCFCE